LDSNSFIVNYCVTYQLLTLLGNYIHWSCEMSNLHIPNKDTCIILTYIIPTHDFEYMRNSFQIQARPATGLKTKNADQQSTPMKRGACSQVDPLTLGTEAGKAEHGPAIIT